MNIEIANRLIKLRKEKGYSQESLAEALGISRQAVSKWERAESSPDTDNLICLAKLYGVSLDELLKTDDSIETIRDEQINVEQNENNTNTSEEENDDEEDEYKIQNPIIRTINGSVPIICVILYLIIGFAFGAWHPGWVVFLLIPIYYSLFDAINKKNPSEFAYPVLVVFFYVLLSSIFGIWHPAWILFLTIPIYYIICDHIKKK